MFLSCCLLCLSSFLGVMSQTLTQSSSEIKKPGERVKMSCKGSGYTYTNYYINWVQQVPGRGLTWIGSIHPTDKRDVKYSSSYQGRFTITSDASLITSYLQIDNLKVEDTATYFCTRWHIGNDYFDIWGQGTLVTVTSDEVVNPQVFPLVPINQEMGFITMGCLTRDYILNPLIVVWNTTFGNTLSGEKNIQFPLSGNPSRYSLVSLMTVSSSQWNSNTYICDVRHFSSSIQRTIPRGCVTPPDSPTVHILQGSCFSNTDDQVELTCQAYNLTTKDAKIKWFINESERPLPQDLLYLENSNLYAVHSTVSISLAEWNNGVRVKCQATDTKTSKSSEATARKCSDIFNCLGIEVIMVPPTIENLYVQKIAPVACMAYNLKEPTGCTFDFNYPGAGASDTLNIQTEDPQWHLNGTFSVISILTVTPETWQSNTEITCIFRFPGLSEKIIRTISKKTETKLISPSIAVFPPPPEDITKDELCTMTCIAYDFYPQDIYMGWTEEGVEISRDQHVNSEPKRNNRNQSFSASSLLSVPCSEWKKGKHYGCLVGQEAIPLKLIQKDIDIHTGKPTKVNVSVVMSDTDLSCY